ncbi:MAG: GNAT family N-acetyltransferase [Gammaproteobacteria bacterium]|nr:GNAT family N-acetyltransferase [Gammaproteobacteria bacterium]MDP2142384.1 GNAT family N-acetyltransferase [Gammaproteobacteria bacterium]MDP2348625.1 GNAT family N-acetyltransferase [Gammaproteobacteria bacterium]
MKTLNCSVPDLQIVRPRGLDAQLLFRVYSGANPIAFAQLSRPPAHRRQRPHEAESAGPGVSYYLRNIAVSQNYRHLGVGSALLDEVLEFCKSQQVSHLYGEAKGESVRLTQWYRDRGFSVDAVDNIEYSFRR